MWCSYWIFIPLTHISSFVTFAEKPSIQGTLLKQELSCVLPQPMNSPVSSLLQRKSCGTIHLSVFESWWEATWRPHSLPTCSSGNWNAFLVCSQLQLFFKVNFKNGVCFLKSSKRHSHSMKQGLKSYLFLHFSFVLFKCNVIYKTNSIDYSGFLLLSPYTYVFLNRCQGVKTGF